MDPTVPARYAIGPLLLRAHQHAAAAFNDALVPLGIQGKHFGILMTLHQSPASQRQLGTRLGVDKSTMVRIVDELEERGICMRSPDVRDRRSHVVELTAAGRDLFVAAEQAATAVSTQLLSPFDPAEQDQLRSMLTRLIAGTR